MKEIFPDKLVQWSDIARGVGEVALQTVRNLFNRHQEIPLHQPDHYKIVVDHPTPNVSLYDAIQLDFEAQAYGEKRDELL